MIIHKTGDLTEESEIEALCDEYRAQVGGAIDVWFPVDLKDDDIVDHWWFVSIFDGGQEQKVLVFGNDETFARFRREHVS